MLINDPYSLELYTKESAKLQKKECHIINCYDKIIIILVGI